MGVEPAPAPRSNQPILRARYISKSYRQGEEDLVILKHADLTVRRGEFVAIEGRSGSGKSTLLHILGGLDTPTTGKLEFEGVEYTSRPSGLLNAPVMSWLATFDPLKRMLVYAGIILVLLALVLASVIRDKMHDWHRPPDKSAHVVMAPGGTNLGMNRPTADSVLYPPVARRFIIFLMEISVVIVAITLYLRWEGRLLFFTVLWICIFLSLITYFGLLHWLALLIFFAGVLVLFCVFAAINTFVVESPISRLRNTQFGFVFQFYHLLPELNVVENTLVSPLVEKSWFGYLANKAEKISRAKLILGQLGLGHRLTHRPNQLSGGERQRVAIARALMNQPKVLFADEPTGNLDYETGRQIMSVLEKLHRENNQTIIMVTHDRSLASQADRVLVLRDGKLEKPGDISGADKSQKLDYHSP